MVCILNNNTDPYVNAATEEFLLKFFEKDCFMLWQNSTSVFVGKHQNAMAEINYNFIEKHNIPVIRRLSGGGTVFHDEGNVNFSFITHAEKGKAVDFKTCLQPIVIFLRSMNINVEINPRNNLFIGEEKISGTAAHIFKNKIIHHGTLLFNSSKENLQNALLTKSEKYSDKAVKSVKSPITNISEHLTSSLTRNEFIVALRDALKSHFSITMEQILNNSEITEIEKLSKNKYQTWEWNFGYSPAFSFNNTVIIDSIETKINLEIKKGKIDSVEISGHENSDIIKNLIIGLPYYKKSLQDVLKQNGVEFWCEYLF